MADLAYKACSRCREVKPSTEFSPDRRASTGLQPACRECSKAAKKAARDANIEAFRARERAYVKANKEQVYLRNNQSRQRHVEKIKAQKKAAYEKIRTDPEFQARRRAYSVATRAQKREYDRQYRELNRERVNRNSANWIKANREKRAAITRCYDAKRRAVVRSGVSSQQLVVWCRKQPKVCYWCGVKCSQSYHVDHYIPLARGGCHELSNLVIACGPCNRRKNAKDPLDFAREVGRLL